jgi:hypothetical protein
LLLASRALSRFSGRDFNMRMLARFRDSPLFGRLAADFKAA